MTRGERREPVFAGDSVAVGILGAGIVLLTWTALGMPLDFEDFTAYARATSVFLEGGNPYATPLSAIPEFQFYSPPYAFAVLWPLGLLGTGSVGVAYLASLTVTIGLASAIFFGMSRISIGPTAETSNSSGVGRRTLWIALALFPVGLIHNVLLWGGLSWVPLLATSLFVWLWSRGNYFLAALSLLLFVVRPHQEVLLLLFISLLFYRRRERNALWGIGIAALFVVVFLAYHFDTARAYLDASSSLDRKFTFSTVTLSSFIAQELHAPKLGVILASVALLALTSGALRRVFSMSPALALPILMPFTLLAGPYAWYHDYLLTLPTTILYARFVACEFEVDRKRATVLFTIGCCVSALQLLTSCLAMRQGLSPNFYMLSAMASAAPSLLLYKHVRGSGL